MREVDEHGVEGREDASGRHMRPSSSRGAEVREVGERGVERLECDVSPCTDRDASARRARLSSSLGAEARARSMSVASRGTREVEFFVRHQGA